ncbi:MAG: ABC transporter permease, partial [Chloroflexota bacterium]
MLRFLRRRAVFFAFTYILTSMFIFFLLRVLPGDPARIIAGGREASEQQIIEIREEFGFDDPIPVQYVRWITNFVQGDWGESASFRGSENRELILQRTRNSLWLAGVAVLISVPLSLVLGIIAGLTENKLPDALISLLSLSVASLPEFVTGLFLVNVVALGWQNNPIAEAIGWWFPASSAIPANASFGEALPSL